VSAALVAGLLAGYGIAVPIGAIGALIVALAARTSLRVGTAAALGVASADGLYAVIAVVGGAAIAGLVAPYAQPLRWVACAVLLAIAAKTAVSALRTRTTEVQARNADGRMSTPSGAYLAFLGLTMLNPATVVYFVALVLGRQSDASAQSTPALIVFVVAAFLASASWQLVLAVSGSLIGRLLTTPRARFSTALLSSAVIAGLAVTLVI
jgi:arginine exporter protein ArgO